MIASIGNVNGLISAHLQLELRDEMDMLLLLGYRIDEEDSISGYLDPSEYIEKQQYRRTSTSTRYD